MYLARVVGDVVSTHKNDRLVGKKLLLVRKLGLDDGPDGSIEVIALDVVDAGAPNGQYFERRAGSQHFSGELDRGADVYHGLSVLHARDRLLVVHGTVEVPLHVLSQSTGAILIRCSRQDRRLIVGNYQQGKGFTVGHRTNAASRDQRDYSRRKSLVPAESRRYARPGPGFHGCRPDTWGTI
ncbi:MAG: hypothetical protein IIA27_07820 [Gemmatimonadetes bacterium]|nr:hypothetical protein [Gemmatimonadota bacterium]